MRDDYRHFFCDRCGGAVAICSANDRGQRYCGADCGGWRAETPSSPQGGAIKRPQQVEKSIGRDKPDIGQEPWKAVYTG